MHIEAFYKDLLKSQIPFNDDTYENFVQNRQLPKLSDDERDRLEGHLRFDECNKKVLQSFQSDKSPGEDGFTAEFYKFFFDLLGNDLIAKKLTRLTNLLFHNDLKRGNDFDTQKTWLFP